MCLYNVILYYILIENNILVTKNKMVLIEDNSYIYTFFYVLLKSVNIFKQ